MQSACISNDVRVLGGSFSARAPILRDALRLMPIRQGSPNHWLVPIRRGDESGRSVCSFEAGTISGGPVWMDAKSPMRVSKEVSAGNSHWPVGDI
jgi:hypothetical protein